MSFKHEDVINMWLLTQIGFFSIVEKPQDKVRGTLTVRGRVGEDLDALRSRYLADLSPTEYSPVSDYAFRAIAPRASVEAAVAALVRDTDYENFKSRVAMTQGDRRAAIYAAVWASLARLQKRLPVFYASIGNRTDIADDADPI